MPDQKKSRSELKREAIISAAKQAFQKDGAQNTSMDSIAAMANVSKRTVYNHFKNKEELVVYVISEFWEQLNADDQSPFDPTVAIADQLAKHVNEYTQLVSCSGYIALTRVAFGYYLYHPNDLKAQVDKSLKQKSGLYRCITDAIQHNILYEHDVDAGIKQIHHLVEGACFWQQFLGVEEPVNESVKRQTNRDTVNMYLNQYAVERKHYR